MSCTETFYIQSATSLKEQIERYDIIINALVLHMQNFGVENSDTESYLIDDGQVRIDTKFRDVVSIALGIEKFISLRNKALNTLNGRVFVLRPSRGLI